MKYVKQAIKNILLKGKPHLFFMHIPKTGGTSIDFAISRHYPIGKYYVDPSATVKVNGIIAGQNPDKINFEECYKLREIILAYKMIKGVKYVTGHVPFRLDVWQAFHEKYLFTTVLRDPVKRFISQYFYNKYKEKDYGKIELSLAEYLDSEKGKQSGSTYVRYFKGSSQFKDHSSPEVIQAAKENLARFDIVGFLEYLDSTNKIFKQISQLKLEIPHQNKNPKQNYQLNEEELAKINRICEPDIEIYEYAKTQFPSQLLNDRELKLQHHNSAHIKI